MIARLEALLTESAGLKSEVARALVQSLTDDDLRKVESHLYPAADQVLAKGRARDSDPS